VQRIGRRAAGLVRLTGGELYHNWLSTVGPAALRQIAQSHFDLFFTGVVRNRRHGQLH
jgi:DeoR/GlpR family transcriptional regulator of sugar metabolism